jgi:hypothetical protein
MSIERRCPVSGRSASKKYLHLFLSVNTRAHRTAGRSWLLEMWRAHTARVPYYVKRPLTMWRLNFSNPSPPGWGEGRYRLLLLEQQCCVVCVQCSRAGERKAPRRRRRVPSRSIASVNWLDSACTSHYLFPLSLSLVAQHLSARALH